jgi:hypothetical protein
MANAPPSTHRMPLVSGCTDRDDRIALGLEN